jgi:hypothetical protein
MYSMQIIPKFFQRKCNWKVKTHPIKNVIPVGAGRLAGKISTGDSIDRSLWKHWKSKETKLNYIKLKKIKQKKENEWVFVLGLEMENECYVWYLKSVNWEVSEWVGVSIDVWFC